jgi:hypothetical protein
MPPSTTTGAGGSLGGLDAVKNEKVLLSGLLEGDGPFFSTLTETNDDAVVILLVDTQHQPVDDREATATPALISDHRGTHAAATR